MPCCGNFFYPLSLLTMTTRTNAFLLVALLGLSQCQKHNPAPVDPLPPATQTGAGTFGCLLNGQPWKPSGNNGYPNLYVTYDPTYHGGNLVVNAYRNTNGTTIKQYISVGGDLISQVGSYSLTTHSRFSTQWSRTPYFLDGNKASPCNEYLSSPGTIATGQLVITRLDKAQGIVSGTFQFTLSQPGCDTIKVTQGRFDSRL
jgi:hypothetical protein